MIVVPGMFRVTITRMRLLIMTVFARCVMGVPGSFGIEDQDAALSSLRWLCRKRC
jgi:hypothetical protein